MQWEALYHNNCASQLKSLTQVEILLRSILIKVSEQTNGAGNVTLWNHNDQRIAQTQLQRSINHTLRTVILQGQQIWYCFQPNNCIQSLLLVFPGQNHLLKKSSGQKPTLLSLFTHPHIDPAQLMKYKVRRYVRTFRTIFYTKKVRGDFHKGYTRAVHSI